MEYVKETESKLNNHENVKFDTSYNGNLLNNSFMNRFKRTGEKSCGCIIFKDEKVLLIQQKRGNWGFPKGHVVFNETEVETAMREVKEETNLDVKIFKNKRYSERFVSNNGKVKQVVYFVANQTGGIEKKQDDEIKAMKWFDIDEALKKITYPNTKRLFKKVIKDMK